MHEAIGVLGSIPIGQRVVPWATAPRSSSAYKNVRPPATSSEASLHLPFSPSTVAMIEKPSFEDTLDDLELSLYRVRIAAQKTINERLPAATQQLARLQVERIETEIQQLRRRADSSTASEVDPILDALELELLDKKIDKARLEANDASPAEQDTADLEVGYVTLQMTQRVKRVQRALASNATAPPSSSDVLTTSTVAAPAVTASSSSEQSMSTDIAAASVVSRAAPVVATRLPSPSLIGSSHFGPLDAVPSVDLPTDLQPAANHNGAAIASGLSSCSPSQDEDTHSPALLPDNDALDAGDIERQLTGDPDVDGVKVKIEPQPPRATPSTTPYIEIDDDGAARDATPPPAQSDSIAGTNQADEDDPSSGEDEQISFPLSGSPRAPKSVQAAKTSGPASPSKAAGESPSKASISASLAGAARSAPGGTQSKKTGGRKEPNSEPERWAFRLQNFGTIILQEASEWPEETCRVVRILWGAVFIWEHCNDFKRGAQKAPLLPASIGSILSKARFGPTSLDVFKKAPDFLRKLAVCFEAIRDMSFANVREMHGLHGLAAVARALLEARRSREDFDEDFLPLAHELTALLEALSAASPAPMPNGVVDGTNVNATVTGGTVLAVLKARPNYDVDTATAVLDILQGRTRKGKGKGKKRDASHLDGLEARPSKQAKNRA